MREERVSELVFVILEMMQLYLSNIDSKIVDFVV